MLKMTYDKWKMTITKKYKQNRKLLTIYMNCKKTEKIMFFPYIILKNNIQKLLWSILLLEKVKDAETIRNYTIRSQARNEYDIYICHIIE